MQDPVPRRPSRTGLLNIPNEILFRILCNLDANALAATALAHHRLLDVAVFCLASLKSRETTSILVDYLVLYGIHVKSLDLSNCRMPYHPLENIIPHCLYITDLNVANSLIFYVSLLGRLESLKHLETLSFTMFHPGLMLSRSARPGRLGKLKKLYVEICPDRLAFKRVVDLVNACRVIETVMVHVMGDT